MTLNSEGCQHIMMSQEMGCYPIACVNSVFENAPRNIKAVGKVCMRPFIPLVHPLYDAADAKFHHISLYCFCPIVHV